jgi:hypothetical protein
LLFLAGSLLPVVGSQQVIDDEIGYFAAQPLSSGKVEAEMLAGEDSA